MPSPPPHSLNLFGPLSMSGIPGDGGPLSVRSSSHGMLAGMLVGLERNSSLGQSLNLAALGLESPSTVQAGGAGGAGGGAMDAAIRGLPPLEVLDWPSSSPRWVVWAMGAGRGGVQR